MKENELESSFDESSYDEGYKKKDSELNQSKFTQFTPVDTKFGDEDDSRLDDLRDYERIQDKKKVNAIIRENQKNKKEFELDETQLGNFALEYVDDIQEEKILTDADKENYKKHLDDLRKLRNDIQKEHDEEYQIKLNQFRENEQKRKEHEENKKAQEIENRLKEDENVREEYDRTTLPSQKVADLLLNNATDDEIWGPLKKYIRPDASKLYQAAVRENASPKDKADWAVYAYGIHTRLNTYLSHVKNTYPERFENDDRIVGLNAAYGMNSKLCAQAIVADPENFLQGLINQAYYEANDDFRKIDKPEHADSVQTKIAKLLYLGRLKYEFENVHGTPEEVKAWKEEILTELMTDRFNEKVEEYKNSEICGNVFNEIWENKELLAIPLEAHIQKALVNMADTKYHEVYSYFANGAQTDEEKAAVLKVTDSLDEMRALADAVGVNRTNVKNQVDTAFHPSFDTMYIKKQANLYGEQKNLAGELNQKVIDEKYLDIEIKGSIRSAEAKYKVDHEIKKKTLDLKKKEHEGKRKELEKDETCSAILTIARYEKEVARINGKIEELSVNPVEGDNIKEGELDPGLQTFVDLKQETQGKIDELKHKLSTLAQEKLDSAKLKIEDYKKEDDTLKKEEEDFRNEEALFEENYNKIPAIVEKKVRKAYGEKLEKRKKNPENLLKEAEEYKAAVEKNDETEIKRIRVNRFLRDEQNKRENSELYRLYDCRSSRDERNHFSLSSAEAMEEMRSSYINYKKNNAERIVDERELDTEFEKSWKEYRTIDAKYSAKPVLKRPDRSTLKINEFKAPEGKAEIGFDHVEIDPYIVAYREPEELAEGLFDIPDDSAERINVAFDFLDEFKNVGIFQSDEYNAIMSKIGEIKEQMASGQDEKTVIIPNCRKALMMLEHYVGRKDDELNRNGSERKSSGKRRIAATFAKNMLKGTVYALSQKNNVSDFNYVYADILAEMEHVNQLTKSRDPEYNLIMEAIRNKTDSDVLARQMQDYLNAKIGDYKGPDGYRFKLDELDERNTRNIPATAKERLFKTVLVGFEKLEKYNLEKAVKEEPEKLAERKFRARYCDSVIANGHTIDDKFGIRVHPENYELEIKVEKKNSLLRYSNEFAGQYRAYINQMKYENAANRIRDAHYTPHNVLPYREENFMIECAFSAKFLNELLYEASSKGIPDADFDFDKVEAERQKVLSLIKESGLFDATRDVFMKEMDLSDEKGADEPVNSNEIMNLSEKKWEDVKNPSKFMEKAVVPALKNEITGNFNRTLENLSKQAVDKEAIRESIQALESNVKLAKTLGLSKQTEGINEQFLPLYRGATLRETVDNLKQAVHNRVFEKPVAPVSGVKL